MTELVIDPEMAEGHADVHDAAAEALHTTLDGVPSGVDGGVAAQELALMITLAVGEAGAFGDANSVMAGVVRSIARSAAETDDSAREAFVPLVEGLWEP